MNTWPIFAQWLNSYILHLWQVPLICVVHDLYPETFSVTCQISPSNPLIWLTRMVDNQVYKRSIVVTALNSTQKECLVTQRGVPFSKISVFYDWLDASRFPTNQPKDGAFRKQLGLSSDLFLAMYVGSLTRMAGLELYVEAAEQLRHRQDIRLLLVGDGAMREHIQSMIRQKRLDNIQVIFPLNPKEVPTVQAASNVLLLSLLPGCAEHTTPSKMIFYMFSQRPVVASVKAGGPPARIIEDAKCGYVISQGDAKSLAERLMSMADDRASLQELGDNARQFAEANFMKDQVLPRVCDLIEQVGSRHYTPQ
jgi:glycosyltransferase involved in cell wall biosynthesis